MGIFKDSYERAMKNVAINNGLEVEKCKTAIKTGLLRSILRGIMCGLIGAIVAILIFNR